MLCETERREVAGLGRVFGRHVRAALGKARVSYSLEVTEMSSLKVLLVLVAVCGLVAMANVASATVITTGTYTAGTAVPTLPASLIQAGSSTLSSDYAGGSSPESWGAQMPPATDMNNGTPTAANQQPILAWDGTTSNYGYAVYQLNTAANPLGYDVSEIDSYAAWTFMRAWQSVDIKYALVGETVTPGSELAHDLGTFNYQPSEVNGSYAWTLMALTDTSGKLMSGISAIEVMYTPNGFNGNNGTVDTVHNFSAYKQFIVQGSPTVIPEPSSFTLLVWALLGFAAYAWRKQR